MLTSLDISPKTASIGAEGAKAIAVLNIHTLRVTAYVPLMVQIKACRACPKGLHTDKTKRHTAVLVTVGVF